MIRNRILNVLVIIQTAKKAVSTSYISEVLQNHYGISTCKRSIIKDLKEMVYAGLPVVLSRGECDMIFAEWVE